MQGDKVKKGQVLGYIEQLGTFMPVQARHLMVVCPVLEGGHP